jgi:hypothetical protein
MTKITLKELKNLIKEALDENRISASQLMSTETDNVDTLLKLMSKYTPKDGWLVSVGYLSNGDIPVKVNPTPEMEELGKKLAGEDENIRKIINSEEWKAGKMKHPHAKRTENKIEIPSTIYKLKTYTCQFLTKEARHKLKSEKDAQVMAAYKTRGVEPREIEMNDKTGLGWYSIEGTPFEKHAETGTQRYAMYRKTNCYKDKSKYFIKIDNNIEELTKEKINFYYGISKKDKEDNYIPPKFRYIEDDDLRNELMSIENLYEFKILDLEKIPFLNCTAVVDGKNIKLTYINKNAVPKGVEKGKFASFIENEIK